MSFKEEIDELVEKYSNWLKDKTILKIVDNQWIEITTPYLDRHNDCLQIYAKKDENGFLLTDDGYILNDLLNTGCDLKSAKRQEFLKKTISGFGVQLYGDQLVIHASRDNFPLKKHSIIQAMLAVNDLFYLATSHTKSLFIEDAVKWLDTSNIRYVPRVKFSGKSGFDNMFDFVIPKSQKSPERIIQTLNVPDKEAVQALVFKWLDTKETRPSDSQLFALLNNSNSNISQSIIDALRNYDLAPILWSERQKAYEILAA
jgi:hypothetical protein